MIIAKPPTSKSNEMIGSPVIKVGCWGLLFILTCSVLLDKVYCASIPVATLKDSAEAAPTPLKNLEPYFASVKSKFTKRNAVYQHQQAFIRNVTNFNLPSASSMPLIYSNASLVPQLNYSQNGMEDSAKSANSAAGIPPSAPSPPIKVSQVHLETNAYQIVGDNSICRSEECFETGMHLHDDAPSNYNLPSFPISSTETESVPQVTPTATPGSNPPLREKIADAILHSEFRKGKGETVMHPRNIEPIGKFPPKQPYEPANYWRHSALTALHKKLTERPVESVAKNIIFFLGDGMSVPTVTAARILKGQQIDQVSFGEEGELHMDTFPYSGISKTFCSDAQVADSACTATAYLCGVKANSGTIGVTPDVLKNNCTAQNEPSYRLSSILAWAQAAGKSTGVVTTARVTHATPAGTYANIANRNWENDHEIRRDNVNPDECDDIAEQLILRDPGRHINVILGGGRLQFLPRSQTDPENGRKGFRTDGKNLIDIWKQERYDTRYAYVEGRQELAQVDTQNTDYLLGLFAPSHMEYYHEQEKKDDPSLTEMTQVALEILSRNPNGFFLFVEGARIDHGHHNNQGMRAIWETVEMDRALQKADELTHDEDTLILVTADHSHTFSIAGYPPRGNPISGIAEIAMDNMPYTTLSYANGPAYKGLVNNKRYNISNDPVDDLKYKQIPNIPRKSETHGGDDVTVLTKGPFAHLFTGVQQQSYIPHALAYAACIGPGPKFCDHAFY